jgi:hypothetical protein
MSVTKDVADVIAEAVLLHAAAAETEDVPAQEADLLHPAVHQEEAVADLQQ